MKNTHILIDTNIVLDLVQKREPYSENASKIINSCVTGENIGYFSAHSLSDYIITRDKENGFKNSPIKIISPEEFLKL